MGQDRKNHQAEQITVSDHAIVRYLERVCGIDMEAVRGEVVNHGQVQAYVNDLGGTGVFPAGGHRVRLINYVVVTTLT